MIHKKLKFGFGYYKIEEKEYSKEELKRCATEIEEYILSHSSKGKEIEKLNNQYASIFSTINRI